MGIAARPADTMAADAQGFPGTSVTARTADRILARLAAVAICRTACAYPTGWMRAAPRARHLEQTALLVTAPTTALVLVTGRAERGILSRFEAVTREETGRVHIRAVRIIEMPGRRQGRHVAAVALQAVALGVATAAQLA
jgi:hypothetical protein